MVLPLFWAGHVAGQDAAKSDLRLFQGTWQAVSIQNPDGQKASAEELGAFRLTVTGNEFVLTGKDLKIAGTFAINPSKTPKHIDVTLANSKDDEGKLLGVYEIQGEIRRSCFAMPKHERPGAVRPTDGKGFLMLEWKRAP
jgi:uncharacterized protein (TIGR03067 family)